MGDLLCEFAEMAAAETEPIGQLPAKDIGAAMAVGGVPREEETKAAISDLRDGSAGVVDDGACDREDVGDVGKPRSSGDVRGQVVEMAVAEV